MAATTVFLALSRRALLLATRNAIRTGLGYGQDECEVMASGKPPARAGKNFVAVHRGGRTSRDRNSLDLTFSIFVTVTLRVNEPLDRVGTDLLEKAQQGLDDRVDVIIALLHMSDEVRVAANTLLLASANAASITTPIYGYSEPFGFEGDDGEPREVGSEWFSAHPDKIAVGYAQQLRFGGARLLSSIANLRHAYPAF